MEDRIMVIGVGADVLHFLEKAFKEIQVKEGIQIKPPSKEALIKASDFKISEIGDIDFEEPNNYINGKKLPKRKNRKWH